MRAMSWSTFERRYQPRDATALGDGSQGDYIVDYRIAKSFDPKHVWTVVTGDNGKLYLASGFHVVNRVGYVVCLVPHDFPERPVLY